MVLVDDENGQVIGELSDSIQVHEGGAMRLPRKGHEKDPVVVELRKAGRLGNLCTPLLWTKVTS